MGINPLLGHGFISGPENAAYFDLWNLIKVIPFPIRDGYWYRLADPYLKSMDDINELDLDWPYLCLELERLDATFGIFHNAKRYN